MALALAVNVAITKCYDSSKMKFYPSIINKILTVFVENFENMKPFGSLALDWLVGPLHNITMAQVNNNHQRPAFCAIWFTSMNSIKVDLSSS